MSIKYLSHTADVCMELTADKIYQLFIDGVIGMSHILKEDHCHSASEGNVQVKINLSAFDYTSLLIDFLSEVLTMSYLENAVFCDVEILHLSEFEVETILTGDRTGAFDEEIKAVTYHEANVVQKEDGTWHTLIIFDI